MGLRFQRVLRIFPWLRINVSKGGVSGSVGPRGADVNIGRHGVTTNAGIPGTGISYRSKVGGRGTLLGVLALAAGLGYAAYKSTDRPQKPAQSTTQPAAQTFDARPATAIRYVRRGGSDLRAAPTTSGQVLKKESKGAQVELLATSGSWAQVRDGNITGWMRASVLRDDPPPPSR
ncbi:MAG: DUF4236 domain-containing protein [Alphaproteobacteria bacterium]|nr:DUF4236 domain-containing protein [Alphaproteobacteria bacterium]